MLALQRIVEDLFLLARAHAGERLLSPSEMYLGELCAESVRSIRTLAARKQITVRYDGSDELPMRGDEDLLRRVLRNLLDNAIKYTPVGGSVTVTASAENGRYVLEVADTGLGVPAEARARVFDRFYRAQRAREAGELASGAGLGLAIAQWIVQAHAGSVALVKSDESGSVFRVTIPGAGNWDLGTGNGLPATAGRGEGN
jgi:signal transduction histidine kinase